MQGMDMSKSVIHTDQVILKPPVDTFCDTTALSRAITTGTIKEVKLLLESGCDPNQPCGTWEMRPLMIAQYARRKERLQKIVQLLLHFGAIPSLSDNKNRNCLMYACALQSCESINKMLQAAEYNFYDTDSDGNTLLHLSAMVGRADILITILKYGARYRCDINNRNKHSLTALMIAILRQRKECTVLLHNHGATPRFTDNDLQSILSMMEENSDSACVAVDVCDLLFRIISDSESVTRKTGSPSHLTEDENQQQINPPSSSPHTDDRKTRNIGYMPLQWPSYMAFIDDVLANSYHTRRSASYCDPQANKPAVNKEWVDSIRQYHHQQEEPCKRNSVPAEGTVKSSRFARTTSTPSSSESPPATIQPRTRPRSLSRSTTSPNLLSSQITAGRKLTTSSERVVSAETTR